MDDIAPPQTETVVADPAAAAHAKSAARSALEGARLKDAIEAGERSIELDPTDGEAWLILGAAYQQKGDWKEARRCYKQCVDQGKRGPRFECAAMLR
jgi:Flp pilus assembly protein TadD